MRRYLVPALAVLGLVTPTVLVTAAPASAAYTTSLSSVSTAAPGHATGTATTDAPYVRFDLLHADGRLVAKGEPQQVSGGTESFDVETWGVSSARIRAMACADALTCDGPRVLSDVLTPSTVVPDVSWPADSTIGSEEYIVSASDPGGGGTLKAQWGFGATDWAGFARQGSSVLPLPTGKLTLSVWRCHSDNIGFCSDTGLRHELEVRREITVWDVQNTHLFSPAVGTKAHVSFRAIAPTVDFNWELVSAATGDPVPGFAGQTTATADSINVRNVLLDLTGLPDGDYKVKAHVSYDDPDFGVVAADFGTGVITADSTPPRQEGFTMSTSALYPVNDDYMDEVWFKINPIEGTGVDKAVIEIVKPVSGEVVHRMTENFIRFPTTFVWRGRIDGVIVAEGEYAVRAIVRDIAGNENVLEGGPLMISHKKVVMKTFKRTVAATSTLEVQEVGPCSTLRKPSLRGWKGSLGLYTNTKCSKTLEKSVVWTGHAMRVPAAFRYESVKVSLYGGADKTEPRSVAYLTLRGADGEWHKSRMLYPDLGNHSGFMENGNQIVDANRWVVWDTFNVGGSRYDVRTYTVTVRYGVLV